MIQRTDNIRKNKYVSCIKINGVPILPPLITPEKQKTLLRYKQQAMKLEKRLKREQELRTYIKQYYLPELTDDNNATSTPIINTLEQQLSFGDLKASESIDNDVPCVKIRSKTSKLSCELQVSQYINNEFALLKHSSSDCDTLRANSVIINLAEDYIEKDDVKVITASELNTSSSKENSPKPHLIRSNSFTIESPSPILLERLNKDFSVEQNADDKTKIQDVSNDSNILLETERSLCDNDGYLIYESNCCLNFGKDERVEERTFRNSEANEYFNDHNESVASFTDLSEIGPDSQGKNVSNVLESNNSNSDFNVLSSDFRFKEFISNNIPHSNNIKSFPSEENAEKEKISCDNESVHDMNMSNDDKKANESKESSFVEANMELKLKLILDNILQTHSKEILELLQTQQEQEIRLDKYQSIRQALLDESASTLKYHETNLPYSQGSKTQSLFIREATCDNENNSSTFDTVNPHCVTSDKIQKEHVNITNAISAQQEWAASVIGARVKGYLTRRLLRTDRVQGLIQTIKDTLICAVQLHTETTEEINESDVELHRRLIQQVSAACYAFHDVFFSLSTKEKMAIINLDRQKQKEKLLRGTNTRMSDKSKPQSARKFSNHK